jgi:hypothetical protein
VIRLATAQYDAANHTVTLVPKRKLSYMAQVTVTQGQPIPSSGGATNRPDTGPRLTDAAGKPINGDTTPGKFSTSVIPAIRPRA